MRRFLLRHWFLILLCLGVLVAWSATEVVRAAVTPIPISAIVPATLFLNAWTLESGRLWRAARRPGAVLLAVAVTYGLLPVLGWLAGGWASDWFQTPDFRLGLLVATSVPCTLVSAVIWTRLAGGDEASALLVTLLTTCTSWFATTAWLTMTTGTAVEIEAGPMMLRLLVTLVLPVAAGQLARWPEAWRAFANRRRVLLSILAQLMVFVTILQSVVMAAERLRSDGRGAWLVLAAIAAVCVAMHLVAAAAGFWTGRALGLERERSIAVAFAGSQKTLPVGVLLIDAHFKAFPLAVVPLLFYHVGQLIVDSLIADRLRRTSPRAAGAASGLRSA